MKKYSHLLLSLIKYNFIRETEFRLNFLTGIFTSIIWIIVQLALIKVFFQYTNLLSGWSEKELFIFIGVYRIITGVFAMFFYRNLTAFSEKIQYGEFDYSLTKPISCLFLESIRRIQFYETSVVVVGAAIIFYEMGSAVFSPVTFFHLIFGIALGELTLFLVLLAVANLNFFATRLTAISSIYEMTTGISRYPVDVYDKFFQGIFSTIFPVALITTVPSKAILGKPFPFIATILVFSILMWATLTFWRFSLRHYTSASS